MENEILMSNILIYEKTSPSNKRRTKNLEFCLNVAEFNGGFTVMFLIYPS